MKKFVSLALALVLVLALSVTVFAAETGTVTAVNGTQDIVVTGKYQPEYVNAVKNYKVVLTWDALELTYGEKVEKVWNTTDLEYTDGGKSENAWTANPSLTVKVDNYSDAAITATATMKEASANLSIDGTATVNVDSAAKNVTGYVGTGAMQTANLVINLATAGSISEDGNIGTITITITEKTAG